MKKRIIWALLLAAFAFQPSAYSKETPNIPAIQEAAPNEADLQEHGSYINEYILQHTQNLALYLMALQHNVAKEAIHSARAVEEHVLIMAASATGYKHL